MEQIEKLKFTSEEIKSDFVANLEWARESSPQLEETFLRCLNRLCKWSDNRDNEVWVGSDFAPRSFSIAVNSNGKHLLNGGMIFHGKHDNGGDGSAPTYSVNLNPHDGWSLHT